MPVFRLGSKLIFPPVRLAEENGILAVGGDLSVKRLLLAYSSGIFPWYSDEEPIIWWSPDPRFVLFPEKLKVAKSLQRIIKSGKFRVTFDKNFKAVIENCRTVKRPYQDGTWITDDMIRAYYALHKAGYAHSVEVWLKEKLAGGLYGISLGKCFFGESMFTHVSDASKVGFVTLMQRLKTEGFKLIDCQVYTDHLLRFGAEEIPRNDFLSLLSKALSCDTSDHPRFIG
ncbi:MAG: leucyl/phenylalanyl-tRNA--protein transferase [Kiritimatiellae bacterium]|nr:leucyl/phenylalanyl-tRNA--protein transferase [Kiritimatiellia bacterium]MDD5520056.1 leucyl/phenylalanyl-tRNA--protein transferase [Kiritimatiellia bacterium]